MNLTERPEADPARLDAIRGILTAIQEQHARTGADLSALLNALGPTLAANPRQSQIERPASGDLAGVRRETSVVVRCLGALEVEIGGVSIESWRSGKARA